MARFELFQFDDDRPSLKTQRFKRLLHASIVKNDRHEIDSAHVYRLLNVDIDDHGARHSFATELRGMGWKPCKLNRNGRKVAGWYISTADVARALGR